MWQDLTLRRKHTEMIDSGWGRINWYEWCQREMKELSGGDVKFMESPDECWIKIKRR